MDISAVSTLANSNNTSAVADKLKNNVKNLSSDSTEDELKRRRISSQPSPPRFTTRAHLKILSLISWSRS